MLDNLKKYKVILASNSPRRKELLAGLGVDYEVRTLPDVDESYPDTLQGADIPLYIAKEKADAYRNMLQPGELMITADTIVWLDGRVLGKPKDREDALCMLRDMSGRTHEVFTGVCITTTEWQRSFAAQTEVRFAELSEEEITYYVDKFQPMDKAGAFGLLRRRRSGVYRQRRMGRTGRFLPGARQGHVQVRQCAHRHELASGHFASRHSENKVQGFPRVRVARH